LVAVVGTFVTTTANQFYASPTLIGLQVSSNASWFVTQPTLSGAQATSVAKIFVPQQTLTGALVSSTAQAPLPTSAIALIGVAATPSAGLLLHNTSSTPTGANVATAAATYAIQTGLLAMGAVSTSACGLFTPIKLFTVASTLVAASAGNFSDVILTALVGTSAAEILGVFAPQIFFIIQSNTIAVATAVAASYSDVASKGVAVSSRALSAPLTAPWLFALLPRAGVVVNIAPLYVTEAIPLPSARSVAATQGAVADPGGDAISADATATTRSLSSTINMFTIPLAQAIVELGRVETITINAREQLPFNTVAIRYQSRTINIR
jgi:hypothetical protein